MDIAEKAFGAFRAQLIAGITQQHNAAKESLKRQCAEQMAQLVREQQVEIDELHDLDPHALVAKCLPPTTTTAAITSTQKREEAAEEVLDSDQDLEMAGTSADLEPSTAAMATAKKRSRASDASSKRAVKRRAQSVVSIVGDDAASASHQPPASPPASIASVVSTRPQRVRKPPPPREINYSKEKKVVQAPKSSPPVEGSTEPEEPVPVCLDLQFCHHILNLIYQARAAQIFLHPVDAAQYPTYYNIISQPMDLSTMAAKLEHGGYTNAQEFKADFDLMIKNCLAFNRSGEEARDFGIMLDRHFSNEWNWRPEWEKEMRRKSANGGRKG